MGNSSNTDKPKKTSFFRGVKQEFKKIAWPDKNEVFKQTVAVSVITLITGLLIAMFDTAIKFGVEWLTTFNLG